ncbi:MAG: LytTR family DNA-binding domain-containing protein, partial [Bacteroidota bacterium]
KTLRHPPQIIVTTAYQEYALEGYELNVVDYLLKPFSLARFLQAVQKAQSPDKTPSSAPVAPLPPSSESSFFLKGDKTHHQVKASEILYVEAYGNYTKVYLRDRMILTHKKISEFEQLLPGSDFMRVHKSFLVAKAKIASIQGNQILIADHTIPIGQTYRSKINDLLSGK